MVGGHGWGTLQNLRTLCAQRFARNQPWSLPNPIIYFSATPVCPPHTFGIPIRQEVAGTLCSNASTLRNDGAADGERAIPRETLVTAGRCRGLEALEQPSQVTLVTTSRYVAVACDMA